MTWNSWYMDNCINDVQRFVRKLQKVNITKQQRKTLRGQAINGDLEGAEKGLNKITEGLESVADVLRIVGE